MAARFTNDVVKILRKYGKKSFFFRAFLFIFSALSIISVIVVFLAMYYSYNATDEERIQNYTQEVYTTRNRIESILSTLDGFSKELEDNEKLMKYLQDGDELTEQKLKNFLSKEAENMNFLKSIYLYNPKTEYILSTSELYHSEFMESFRDNSWMDAFYGGKKFFYREYPDTSLILKCLSYCTKVGTTGLIAIYNIDYSKANLSNNTYRNGNIYIFDTQGDVLLASQRNVNLKTQIDSPSVMEYYFNAGSYVTGYKTLKKMYLGAGFRRYELVLMFEFPREMLLNLPTFLLKLVLLGIFALMLSLGVSLLLTSIIYKPLVKLFMVVDAPDKIDAGGNNEINNAIEYITDTARGKDIAEKELAIKALQLQNAQLIALQAQLNPHFLFNTLQMLNTIILAEFKRDTNATRIISLMSVILRDALNIKKCVRTFKEEADIANRYIDIQKIRFGEGFDVEWHIPDELMECMVPKCILQPILENSISYGINIMGGKGIIQIKARKIDTKMEISIHDNGPGFEEEKLRRITDSLITQTYEQNDGVGLSNVDRRIKVLFGDDYGIEIFNNNGAEIIINLPINYM